MNEKFKSSVLQVKKNNEKIDKLPENTRKNYTTLIFTCERAQNKTTLIFNTKSNIN